jgi:hypothetical protein
VAVFAVPVPGQSSYFPIEGYINVLRSPTGFEVGGRWFAVTGATAFGVMGSKSASPESPLRSTLRIGVYVQVEGRDEGPIKPFIAQTVMIRDDWDQKIGGVGVITRVVAPGPTAVFEADGYFVRVTASTRVAFLGGLSSLDDVSENTWLQFSGRRGKDGILEASKAQFFPAKPTKFKAVKGLEIATVKARSAGAKDGTATSEAAGTPATLTDGVALQQDEQVKIGLGRWHTVPADQPLQERLHRIGMALVPAYQRALPDDDPSKIHFRFFAVDNSKERGAVCLLDGAVLVSKQTIERLSNNDELAAVVADGVACNLQRQAARTVVVMRTELGVDLALDIAGAFVPGVGLARVGLGVGRGDEEEAMEEERLRLALMLMQDAGYDPWQAPEAWRFLEPKKLPAKLASLKYPDSSCYQIGILNLQYARK